MSTKKIQIIGGLDHKHKPSDLQLYDTVSANGTLEVTTASQFEHTLDVTLSSETYVDFSSITVVLTSDNGTQSVVANADGSVTGLLSQPSFTLSLEPSLDASDILITCTYQLDLDKVLHDYILHVDLDGESGEEGGFGAGNVVYRTRSFEYGFAAWIPIDDASIIEHDVKVVISSDKCDDVSGITVNFATQIGVENIIVQSATTDADGVTTLRSVSEPWFILLNLGENQADYSGNDFVVTYTYQLDVAKALDILESAIGSKVDKIEGKGLSSNDFTNAHKDKLENLTTEGLATEQFVLDALDEFEIPDVQASVDVYQIDSESVVVDELVTSLPEGTVVKQGDVMIVTNSLGVKSAYQYDEGWIACDGNVDASKVIMPFDITLAGEYTQVGTLTKTKTGTAKFETKGKSVAVALQQMLSEKLQPKITSYPSVSLTITNGDEAIKTAYEVGTTITPKWSAKLNPGSYTYGPATGITAKTWLISDANGKTSVESDGSFEEITIGDDTSYTITATATYDAAVDVIAKDNLGGPSDPTIQIAAGSKSATSSAITGYRSWFMYIGTDNVSAIDSAFIRKSTNKGTGSAASTQNNVEIPQGTKRVMIAIPQKYSKALTSVIHVDGMGLDLIGKFTPSIVVNVEGVDGHEAMPYNVWVQENNNGLAAAIYNLIIS